MLGLESFHFMRSSFKIPFGLANFCLEVFSVSRGDRKKMQSLAKIGMESLVT